MIRLAVGLVHNTRINCGRNPDFASIKMLNKPIILYYVIPTLMNLLCERFHLWVQPCPCAILTWNLKCEQNFCFNGRTTSTCCLLQCAIHVVSLTKRRTTRRSTEIFIHDVSLNVNYVLSVFLRRHSCLFTLSFNHFHH